MPETEPEIQGWAMPFESRRFHFFVDGRSLCGRWGSFLMAPEAFMPDAPNVDSDRDCKACARRVATRRAKGKAA